MLADRITGAFSFRRDIYAEVERDTSFTSTAWLLVVITAFLNQLGSKAGTVYAVGGVSVQRFGVGIFNWIISTLIGTVFMVAAFAVGVWLINLIGRTVFHADVNFNELVRTLGLAYVWNAVAILGIFAAITPVLGCVLTPIQIVAAILGLVAWFIAAKEALDLQWVETIITVFIGWLVKLLASFILGLFLTLLGFTAAALGGLFG
jgi:hypothetical protein